MVVKISDDEFFASQIYYIPNIVREPDQISVSKGWAKVIIPFLKAWNVSFQEMYDNHRYTGAFRSYGILKVTRMRFFR